MPFPHRFTGAKKFNFKCNCTLVWQSDIFFSSLGCEFNKQVEKENREEEKQEKIQLALWKIY